MNIQGKIIRNIVVKFIDNLAIKCCFQDRNEGKNGKKRIKGGRCNKIS